MQKRALRVDTHSVRATLRALCSLSRILQTRGIDIDLWSDVRYDNVYTGMDHEI